MPSHSLQVRDARLLTMRLRARNPKERTFATVPVPQKEAEGGAGAAGGRRSGT
jgi:hypothetical protein